MPVHSTGYQFKWMLLKLILRCAPHLYKMQQLNNIVYFVGQKKEKHMSTHQDLNTSSFIANCAVESGEQNGICYVGGGYGYGGECGIHL